MREEDRFVHLREAAEKVFGVHPDTLLNWVKAGRLAEPLRMSRKSVGWPMSVLQRALLKEGRAR